MMFYTSYDVYLSIKRTQLSFVQFSLLCYKFCILSKTECKSIYYHFRRDHYSSNFQKLARNKWICQETCDFFRDQFTLFTIISFHQFFPFQIATFFDILWFVEKRFLNDKKCHFQLDYI